MESDKKFKARCASWQVIVFPASVMLRKDGQVLMSVGPDKLSEVAANFAGKVERTINAMRDNDARIITFHMTWE